MPWTPEDARSKTHEVKDDKDARQWRDVANEVLKKTGDEGRAIREANNVVRRNHIKGGTRDYSDD